ncbi:MAG: pyridoxal phosphate-dependent decarboxylase family protein [Desulfotignum sp.]
MEQEQILDRLHQLLKSYLAGQTQGRFVDYKDPAELSEILNLDAGQHGADWELIFDWIEKYLAFSVKTGHPGFLNRMWAGANLPSILGEIVTAVSNTSACTYESAPVSTVMEQYMLDQMLDLAGFTNGEAQMTTGSSNANLLAMMAARNSCQPGVKTAGLFSGQPMTAFVSADAHYSMEKATNVLGRVCSSGDDSYIFHTTDDNRVRDLGAVSLQCGRRVDCLKWFLDWKFFGKTGFARMVEHGLDLCRYAEQRIRQSDHLEMVYPRNAFNVCFRYKPTRANAGPFNLALRNTLYHQGKSLVGYAQNKDGPFLRLLLASHDLDEKDVDLYFSQLIETGKDLERKYP